MRGLFAALMILGTFCAFSAFAEETAPPSDTPPLVLLKHAEASHPERVLLAFYKVTGEVPDFDDWAAHSPFLKDAKDMDRDVIINREANRLRRAYAEFDASEPIVVHTEIYLDKYSTLQEKLQIAEFNPKTFFNYQLYGERIALIPKDIANFGAMPIKQDAMNEMLGKAGGGVVDVEIFLKPVLADAQTPFVYGGKSYWLLMGEIGEIRFWSKAHPDQLLWMYRADWFKTKENESLMKLKGDGL